MYKLTKKAELKTDKWAGGTTTQLAIFPPTAEYKKFNFDFRISYATVEVEESVFTFMPGVTRHLMILNGTLEIDHREKYKRKLDKFEKDIFSGEWPTTAKGKVTDFNLMTRGSVTGFVEPLIMEENSATDLITEDKNTYTAIYLPAGELEILYGSESLVLDQGDFIIFDNEQKKYLLKANKYSEAVVSRVKLF